MKKLFKILSLKVVAVFLLVSCSNNDEPILTVPKVIFPDTVSSTVLVYMIGQNNLAPDLEANIQSMKQGMEAAPYGSNWLVYLDKNVAPELYHLIKGEDGKVRIDTLQTYKDQFSTDPEILRDVVLKSFGLFPADNYGLILSSHANGWFPAYNKIEKRSFGEEYGSGYYYNMDIPDMARALEQVLEKVPRLNYIMFDACLMGNVEIAYEFRNVADYMIASPASVISWGFPYEKIVSNLLKMSEKDYTKVLNEYYARYQQYFGTLSVVRLSEMQNLAATLHTMMSLESTRNRALQINRDDFQIFEPEFPSYDFGQLVDSLGTHAPEYKLAVQEALARAIYGQVYTKYSTVNNYGYIYNEIKNCSGLTSYIPIRYGERSHKQFYKQLEWFKASGWDLTSCFD